MTTAAEKTELQHTGLYDPANEHDACGVGFVAHIKGEKSHAIVQQGLKILENLDHRGAVGADKLMGDGAGILIQIPDDFFRAEMALNGRAPDGAVARNEDVHGRLPRGLREVCARSRASESGRACRRIGPTCVLLRRHRDPRGTTCAMRGSWHSWHYWRRRSRRTSAARPAGPEKPFRLAQPRRCRRGLLPQLAAR